MKRKFQTIVSIFACSILTFSAPAQDTQESLKQNANRPREDQSPSSHARIIHLNGVSKASDVIGITAKNKQDETLGKVEEIAVDVESGRIIHVILSTGGYLGISDTLMAVPPGALQHDVAGKFIYLDVNKERLKEAPLFDISKWTEYLNSKYLSKVYSFYGEAKAFDFVLATEDIPERKVKPATIPGKLPAINGAPLIPESGLFLLQRTSKLMGIPVKNMQEEKVGKVEDVLLDLPSGRILALIISTGGFLGMGDELSAIPPTAFRFTADMETLQLDVSKEVLAKAPHFKDHEWPDFGHPTYADGVYRAYKVTPYFVINPVTTPDNTRRNVRDRDGKTVTPLDQGSSQADIETTTLIRKEIMGTENMSTNGKNIKIITINGRVTLRGPVNTSEEQRIIHEIAGRIVRANNIEDQLEVQLTGSK